MPAAASSRRAAPARRRARRGDGGLLRQQIVAAATSLLVELGDEDAVSIRAIADAVGVTPPSIYLHFADKEELLLAVCEDRFAELDRVSNLAVKGVTDPLQRVRLRGEAYIRFGVDHPEHYRILFMGSHKQAATPERLAEGAAFAHLLEDVTSAMDAGLMPGTDPFVSGLGLWATVHGITSLMIAMPAFDWPPIPTLLSACGAGTERRKATPAPAHRGGTRASRSRSASR